MNVFQQRLLAVAAATLLAGAAHAGTVASRSDLQTALGGVGSLETFEGIGGGIYDFSCTGGTFSTGSACGAPTGSLKSGISYTSAANNFQLDTAGYYGAPSEELLSNDGALNLNFTGAVNAIGMDLRAFSGYGANATITVYGKDGNVLDTVTGLGLSGSGAPTFFGYESATDIGSVSLSQGSYPWSPLLDNVEWGATATAVPEPTSFLLMGLSLGLFAIARRKRA